MPPHLSEEEIDDLLYYARTGDLQELSALSDALCRRNHNAITPSTLLAAKDTDSGNGPLHMAAANGHIEILTYLITRLCVSQNPIYPTHITTALTTEPLPKILNVRNASGNTALHWAALNGHLECVKVLLDNGADPTLTNGAGHDAVYEAEAAGRREVVEWVLREGGEGLEVGVAGGTVDGENKGEVNRQNCEGAGGNDEGMVEKWMENDHVDEKGSTEKFEEEERIREGIRSLEMSG